MPRKKRNDVAESATSQPPTRAEEQAVATLTPPADDGPRTPEADVASPTDGTGKSYGQPYKSVFTSADKAFELGENRRFKQRVFTFKEKPEQQVIDRLKEHGFVYRAAEKAWTVEATAESRVLTDRLAREFAGKGESIVRG